MKEVGQRNAVLDVFKGIAVLSVIIIHAALCTGLSYRPLSNIFLGFGQIGLFFAGPMFFFLSGWATTLSQNSIKHTILRLMKLYILYVIMVVFLVLSIIAFFNEPITPYKVSRWLTFRDLYTTSLPVVMASMWFIVTYFMIYLTTPLLMRIYKKNIFSIAFIFLLVIVNAIFIFGNVPIGTIYIYPTTILIKLLFYCLLFYFMGMYLHKRHITSKEFAVVFAVLLSLCLLCIFRVNFNLNLQPNKFPITIHYQIIASLFSILFVLYARNIENNISELVRSNVIFKFLSYNGKNVFNIYLYQGFGSSIPTLALPYLLGVTSDWRLLLFINFTTIVLITYPLAHAFKFINDCVLNKCFSLMHWFGETG